MKLKTRQKAPWFLEEERKEGTIQTPTTAATTEEEEITCNICKYAVEKSNSVVCTYRSPAFDIGVTSHVKSRTRPKWCLPGWPQNFLPKLSQSLKSLGLSSFSPTTVTTINSGQPLTQKDLEEAAEQIKRSCGGTPTTALVSSEKHKEITKQLKDMKSKNDPK